MDLTNPENSLAFLGLAQLDTPTYRLALIPKAEAPLQTSLPLRRDEKPIKNGAPRLGWLGRPPCDKVRKKRAMASLGYAAFPQCRANTRGWIGAWKVQTVHSTNCTKNPHDSPRTWRLPASLGSAQLRM
ncbi:hypothetical protein L1887_53933 [Cichorium endivia]|nr:hypothetical protein L1887_53933 [Cichorium endivia]